MNIFNYLSSILFTKKTISPGELDQQSDYQPYLVNRWCSMLNKHTCVAINSTANHLYSILENKQTHWKFLHYILPKNSFKKINYHKKQKVDNKHKDIIVRLARRLELSTNEINSYIEQTNIDLSKYEQ